ncbi:MAG: alpha/beta hydrolase [Ruminococcaceae bacterium]|nr:alpha/beta hydrolase [Oscillospiraceae bacterium]
MKCERIYLYEDRQDVYLDTYVRDTSPEYPTNKRPAMLIFPGGGYGFCSDREAEPIANQYLAAGLNCFVLRYSIGENASRRMPEFSQPLLDASLAMAIIRKNAEEWNIDTDKIAIIGFSAGGHLAGSLATMWNDEAIWNELDIPAESNKPNAAILAYPVLTFGKRTHGGTRDNLLGKYCDDEALVKKYSLENNVSKDTPPTFIMHTAEDGSVPVVNSLNFATSLSQNEIPFELHVFPFGGHGMSTGTKEVCHVENKHAARWVELSVKWLKQTFDM